MLYVKNDFNKNNLIDSIPSIELIHTSSRGYHIYMVQVSYIKNIR